MFLGKLIGQLVKSATTGLQPYTVDDVKPDQYLRCDVMLSDELIKLYRVNKLFECVLYPTNGTGSVIYSLCRVPDLPQASRMFETFSSRLAPLLRADVSLQCKRSLQSLCDQLREHPSWSSAHLVASMGIIQCLHDPEILRHLNDQETDLFLSPVHLAVQAADIHTVTELLLLNARLDASDVHGNTVYHLAAVTDAKMIQFLAGKNRAMLNKMNAFGETPLHVACRHGNEQCLEALMRWGGDPGLTASDMYPVHLAIRHDHLKCMEVLHQWCPQVFQQQDTKYGACALHWSRSKQMTTALLDRKCDLHSQNRLGDSALHVMILKGRLECALALLTYGADTNLRGRSGNTALHTAAGTDSVDMVRAMIVFGADVDAVDTNQESARHLITRSPGTNRDVLLYIVHAVGARRCAPSIKGCHEGCSAKGRFDGKPQGANFVTGDIRNQIYDDVLCAAIVNAALSTRGRSRSGPSQDVPDSGPTRGLRVLSLDGGGIRGLILIQLLLAVESRTGRPIRDCFDWIAGTSTGGILAIAILVGKSLRYAQGLYFHLKDEVFVGKRPYDSGPLETFMKREFGEHTRMNDREWPRVMVSGVLGDRHPAELHFFTNYTRPLSEHVTDIDNGQQHHLSTKLPPPPPPNDQYVWRAARCTGAAPTYFRACGRFLDGGLIANNPCLDLMTEIHEYNTSCHKKGQPQLARPIELVVSLGTGKIPVQEVKAVDLFRPEGIMDLWKSAVGASNLATLLVDQATNSEGRAVDRSRAWCGMAQIPYFRFSPPISEDIPLDATNDSVLLNMLWESQVYIYNNRGKIGQLADLLK